LIAQQLAFRQRRRCEQMMFAAACQLGALREGDLALVQFLPKSNGVVMNKFMTASLILAAIVSASSQVSAQQTEQSAPASLTPFYKALNAANIKEAPELIKESTTSGWLTCRGNDLCNSRDEVLAGMTQRLRAIPDLKWDIKEILVSGNRVIVRGEATGTPAGELMGTPTNGKSFKLMSLDVHTLEGGKIARTYHVEDWQGAFRQVSQK
jgi:predicted ester cyclase